MLIGLGIGIPFSRNIVKVGSDPHPGNNLLLETSDFLLLEDGSAILLEF